MVRRWARDVRGRRLAALAFLVAVAAESVPNPMGHAWASRMERRFTERRQLVEREVQRQTGELKARLETLLDRLRSKSSTETAEEEVLRPPSGDMSEILPASDLGNPSRAITIVTTAALPWMTGTAVNPLLRAAHLTRGREAGKVVLYVPWLDEAEQPRIFAPNVTFATREAQEEHIRSWLRRAGLEEEEEKLRICFYQATYVESFGSLFPAEDVLALIPDTDADVCILEEPEHLNWYRLTGLSWKDKFGYVVGIMHTNYLSYVMHEALPASLIKEFILSNLNRMMCRAYCDRIIKLSGTLQEYAPDKEIVCNVHGVRDVFLTTGDRVAKALRAKEAHGAARDAEEDFFSPESDAAAVIVDRIGNDDAAGIDTPFFPEVPVMPTTAPAEEPGNAFPRAAYFIGKSVWAKGHGTLIRVSLKARRGKSSGLFGLIPNSGTAAGPAWTWASAWTRRPSDKEHGKESDIEAGNLTGLGDDFFVDVYGSGPEHNEIVERAMEMDAPLRFHGAIDHAKLAEHKVLVNPSVSEVLATTVAEAIAMNKFVVCARHPSNAFFYSTVPNCLTYTTEEEFVSTLTWALQHDPAPLTPEQRYALTWEAATERLIGAAKITYAEAAVAKDNLDHWLYKLHHSIGANPATSVVLGTMGANAMILSQAQGAIKQPAL